MNSSTAAEASLQQPAESGRSPYFRPARALIGWMPPEGAHQLLVTALASQTIGPDVVARARSARDFASKRAPITQKDVVGDLPSGIGEHLALLRQNAQNLFDEGFRVCTVDLSQLYAIQPTTFMDHHAISVATLDPDDTLAIAKVTLPHAVEVQLAVGQDPAQKTITLSSSNLNLQAVGFLQPQMGPNGCAVGFQTTVSNSLLQVARFDGHYYCRDGHTRAVQLLKRGIARVPGLVKEFTSYSEVAPRPNLLPEEIAHGTNPPTLHDFLDDRVSDDVLLPMTRKAIVISASEIEIPV